MMDMFKRMNIKTICVNGLNPGVTSSLLVVFSVWWWRTRRLEAAYTNWVQASSSHEDEIWSDVDLGGSLDDDKDFNDVEEDDDDKGNNGYLDDDIRDDLLIVEATMIMK